MGRVLMKAAVVMALSLSCRGDGGPPYSWNDLRLISRYTATAMCSCLFVMEHDEQFCRGWSQQNPPVARISIDRQAKTVTASTMLMWGASARFMDERSGCALE